MQNRVDLFLELKPHPQERVRFHIRGSRRRPNITPYYPKNTRDFQNAVREMVRQHMADCGIVEFEKGQPLYMGAIFYLNKPKSAKREWPTVRPDLSNFFKAVEDGMQRASKDDEPALIEDDSSICIAHVEKRYVNEDYPEPGILLTVGVIDEDYPTETED